MTFKDLDEFLLDPPKRLPISGTVYEFPGSISARLGLLLQRIQVEALRAVAAGGDKSSVTDLANAILTEEEGEALRAAIMGATEQQMIDDGRTSLQLEHTWHTLIAWHMAGEEAAQLIWSTPQGEAPAPNRAARRAGSKAAASTTRSPTSGSGTSTRARAKAAGSSGRTSSPAGP